MATQRPGKPQVAILHETIKNSCNSSESRDLLRTSSVEAQIYRRQLLKGLRVLIVQGGSADKGFIYKCLQNLGVHTTMIDSARSIWKNSLDLNEFIAWEPADSDGESDCVHSALKAIAGRKFDGVITFWEDIVIPAARIASELGLALNPVSAFRVARSKLQTRNVLHQAGLPAPKFYNIVCNEDVMKASKHVGFPAVLKPVTGSGSFGVRRVDNEQELQTAYKKATKSTHVDELGVLICSSEMILEEMYVGVECDVDLLLCSGKAVYSTVIDNWDCAPPWFQELGSNCPSLLPEHAKKSLIDLAVASTRALGFVAGVLHVELMWTKEGARLIEVNSRMGGGPMHELNLVAWGVDLIAEHTLVSCGIPIAPVVPKTPLRYLAHCYLNAPFSGTMKENDWLDFALEETHRLEYFKKPGESVQGPEDGVPEKMGRIYVVSNSNMKEACNKARDIVMKTQIPIEAKVQGVHKPFFFPHKKHPFGVIA